MKIKLNSEDELHLNKMTEIPCMKIAVRAIFLENIIRKFFWINVCINYKNRE